MELHLNKSHGLSKLPRGEVLKRCKYRVVYGDGVQAITPSGGDTPSQDQTLTTLARVASPDRGKRAKKAPVDKIEHAKLGSYLKTAPHIVYNGKAWTQICCPACKGNSRVDRFVAGAASMRKHLYICGFGERSSYVAGFQQTALASGKKVIAICEDEEFLEVLRQCAVREVPDQEIQSILDGKVSHERINLFERVEQTITFKRTRDWEGSGTDTSKADTEDVIEVRQAPTTKNGIKRLRLDAGV